MTPRKSQSDKNWNSKQCTLTCRERITWMCISNLVEQNWKQMRLFLGTVGWLLTNFIFHLLCFLCCQTGRWNAQNSQGMNFGEQPYKNPSSHGACFWLWQVCLWLSLRHVLRGCSWNVIAGSTSQCSTSQLLTLRQVVLCAELQWLIHLTYLTNFRIHNPCQHQT